MTTYSANQTEKALDKIYDLHANTSLASDKDMTYDLRYAYNSQSDAFALSGTQRYAKPIQNPPVFQAINRIPTVSRNTNIALLSEAVDSTDEMGTTRYVYVSYPRLLGHAYFIDTFLVRSACRHRAPCCRRASKSSKKRWKLSRTFLAWYRTSLPIRSSEMPLWL